MSLRYLSVCSGIEAATVAWHDLDLEPVAFSEIDAFPCAVLAHHYPDVANWGDLTKFQEWPDATVDVLVGGTPCQSFSVAGLRAGLADPRGNLALTYLAVVDRYRPRWVVWENVPGVLSADEGRAFGAFLGGLGQLGYGFAYRVLDAQYFGLAQRRKRVFVVGHLGDWRRAAAVLFERASLSGHPAPRRETGQRLADSLTVGANQCSGTAADFVEAVAPTLSSRRTGGGGGLGTDFDCDGGLIPELSDCLTAREHKGPQPEAHRGVLIAHALRADGFDASEDGTLVAAVGLYQNQGSHGSGDTTELAPTLKGGDRSNFAAVAFDARQSDVLQYGDQSGPLDTDWHSVAVAFALGSHAGAADADVSNRSHASGGPTSLGIRAEQAHALRGGRTQSIATTMQVRRLTPRECERLQGFPDDYTHIPYRGKPAADGPRYKALGNSMAVPVMRWIGQRLLQVDALDP